MDIKTEWTVYLNVIEKKPPKLSSSNKKSTENCYLKEINNGVFATYG